MTNWATRLVNQAKKETTMHNLAIALDNLKDLGSPVISLGLLTEFLENQDLPDSLPALLVTLGEVMPTLGYHPYPLPFSLGPEDTEDPIHHYIPQTATTESLAAGEHPVYTPEEILEEIPLTLAFTEPIMGSGSYLENLEMSDGSLLMDYDPDDYPDLDII